MIQSLIDVLGMPCAWMLSSNATGQTIYFFLKTIRLWNTSVIPRYFMSNRDLAQLNAISSAYHESIIFLCWWHVLHAWQQHFSITAHPGLWEILKKWVRLTDATEFNNYWLWIQLIAPSSMTEYLQKYWVGGDCNDWITGPELWSAVFRIGRDIEEVSDTNMLVEAYILPNLLSPNVLIIQQLASLTKRGFSRRQA